jgi:predicted ATPase
MYGAYLAGHRQHRPTNGREKARFDGAGTSDHDFIDPQVLIPYPGSDVNRGGVTVRIRDPDGGWHAQHDVIRPYDSMLSEYADPQRAPDLLRLREQIRSWRFYDHVRTDAHAPARVAQIGTRTPVLGHDGADLAAALQTIREVGDHEALDTAVAAAFPGSRVEIVNHAGRFEVTLRQDGLLRPLGAAEFSDGTLRYLLWTAALLTPRPPTLLVLNEPETSLHPDLLRPLAGLILATSIRTQIIVVTHARALVSALDHGVAHDRTDLRTIELVKDFRRDPHRRAGPTGPASMALAETVDGQHGTGASAP